MRHHTVKPQYDKTTNPRNAQSAPRRSPFRCDPKESAATDSRTRATNHRQSIRDRRNSSAFPITLTSDSAIAPAAHIGVSSPSAASGIISTL